MKLDLTNEQAKGVYSALIDARYKIGRKLKKCELNSMPKEQLDKMRLEVENYTEVIMVLGPMIKR